MNIGSITMHHIRNCTEKLFYAGVTILVDPFFAPKGHYPGFDLAPTPEARKARGPLTDLKVPIDEIIKDIDAIIITHTHSDHWDEYIQQMIIQKIFLYLSKIYPIKN